MGAESQYANLISQIGGRYVTVTALIDNPNTDPHTFETSPAVAGAISSARLVVQNGLGYDGFMNRIESAAPSHLRRVIDVQHLLGVPASESNPHLWYSPRTPPLLATAIADALAKVAPRHAAYFRANAQRFDRSLRPWYRALSDLHRQHPDLPVATSEPVANYLLGAAGARVLTPYSLQLDIMNGTDPAPQNITAQDELLVRQRVRAFLYNRQVTDSVTQSFLRLALAHHIPVVAVYETMPAGYDYQGWMLAETRALERAAAMGVSTRSL
ncbi:MAG TPA: zinc ABC transporter substrate-binding protein [Solirubrobacteraceae bacterium]|nr:zinc ABC transporter substrate-binding protein [Solirubrobacteraceae bacterium]